jgi:hypothetical protein
VLLAVVHVIVDHASHALPVVPVKPEVVQSLPPVTIGHIAEGPNPWIAFYVAIGVSGLAVIVAVVTLIMVCRQIKIANRQLRVAYKELKAVNSDFRLAQRQFNAVTRRPKISVTLSLEKPVLNDFSFVAARFAVSNDGDRLAGDVRLELLVLEDSFLGMQGNDFGVSSESMLVNGIPYRVFGMQLAGPLYPNNVFKDYNFPTMRIKGTTSELLFRVYDESYAYPVQGYGVINFTNTQAVPLVTYPYGVEPARLA